MHAPTTLGASGGYLFEKVETRGMPRKVGLADGEVPRAYRSRGLHPWLPMEEINSKKGTLTFDVHINITSEQNTT